MGELCTQARFLDGNPAPLRRTNKTDLCDRCEQEGYTLEDVHSSGPERPKSRKRCPGCGEEFRTRQDDPGVDVGFRQDILGDEVVMCAGCNGRVRSGAGYGYHPQTEVDSPLPLPRGFDQLFKAARVLLEVCAERDEEDRIIPTLALAYHLCHGVPRLVAQKERLTQLAEDGKPQEKEANGFARRYSGLKPDWVVDDVLILKRFPVSVRIGYGIVRGDPQAVTVEVYPHQSALAEPKVIAELYAQKLAETGISCDEKDCGNLSYSFHNDRLEPDILPGTAVERTDEPRWQIDRASFPHPQLVGGLYEPLRREFIEALATRTSSGPPKSRNLVPACVGFLLNEYGIERGRRMYRWLDKHVLSEKGPKLDDNPSRINQLRNTMDTKPMVRNPLMDCMRTLFWEGFEA
jgi:hypothetical protein